MITIKYFYMENEDTGQTQIIKTMLQFRKQEIKYINAWSYNILKNGKKKKLKQLLFKIEANTLKKPIKQKRWIITKEWYKVELIGAK